MTDPPAARMPTGPDDRRCHIWVVSDGTAGMRLQAIAMMEALLKARPDWTSEQFVITPHQWIRAGPRLGALLPKAPLYAASQNSGLERRPHAGRYPDILITCGRRMAGYALALRRRARAEGITMNTVHLQDPRLPPRLFDALVVPAHDPARADNVLVTTGSLNRLTLAGMQKAMMDLPTRWLSAARSNSVTVMIGGDNRRYAISPEMTASMGERLATLARTTGTKLLLIPSRRTPAGLVDSIAAALPDNSVLTPQADEPNVYPGVLGLGQAVIVTSDSVNMASEAAITGKPLMVIGWKPPSKHSPTGETGRIAAFHRHMIQGGHSALFDGHIPAGNFSRLDEMEDVAHRLLTLLGR